MASRQSGGVGILQQLTPLGKRLLSGGSVMESAMAPNGCEDRKSGLRPLHLQLISKTTSVADPRFFSLVNPFRTKDEPIEVVVVGTDQSADKWSRRLREAADRDGIIGFDLEWRPSYTRHQAAETKPALVQMSTRGLIVLIQLKQLSGLPEALVKLLTDETLIKVGVAIGEDLEKLYKSHNVDCRGFYDVGLAASRVFRPQAGGSLGLGQLMQVLCGVKIDKSKSVRMSNWEQPILQEKQIQYAALDALVGREAYLELEARGHLDKEYLLGLMMKWLEADDRSTQARARRLADESDHFMEHYCDLLKIGEGKDDLRQRKAQMLKEVKAARKRRAKDKRRGDRDDRPHEHKHGRDLEDDEARGPGEKRLKRE